MVGHPAQALLIVARDVRNSTMETILPPGMTAAAFDAALVGLRRLVGDRWVLATDDDRATYGDAYAMGDGQKHGQYHAPAAAVAPASVEEVRAVVRFANEHRLPLWPISRGKNFGYGGAAPAMPGTTVLDLGRLNRIVDIDEKLGVAVLEPGVGFFDLHAHLAQRRIPLWMSIPGNAWGSVIGNALERGFSASLYGEHVENLCGLEVVLPDGDLVRTGTGAMAESRTGPLFKYGFGPGWDQMFVQSGLGVVTRAGYWLMPEPEASLTMSLALPDPDDIGWLVDALTPLRLRGIIHQNIGITSYMAAATTRSQRSEWHDGPGALPDDAIAAIQRKYDAGWWNLSIRLYGLPEVVEAHRAAVEAAIAPHTERRFAIRRWRRGDTGSDPLAGPPSPTVFPLQIVNWHGGRGGHVGFSPILPASGKLVLEQFRRTRRRFQEFGIDYSGTFYVNGRYCINVNLILYDRDDAEMTGRVRGLFKALIADSAAHGYAEYRTHLSYMDAVAATFDHNDHALRRLNERVKDALDPVGVIAPGKSGIWPARYRAGRDQQQGEV